MKHFNFLSNFRWFTTVILLITLGIGQMWGGTETLTMSSMGWDNAEAVTSISASSATIAVAKNSGTQPAYYSSDYTLRIYGVKKTTTGGSITFTAVDEITQIVFTGSFTNSGTFNVSTGTYNASTSTWSLTGNLTAGNAVTFIVTNNTNSNPQARITEIAITYKAKVTFNANGGSCATSNTTQATATSSISLPTPTRAGFNCTGWYTATSGGTKRGNAGGTYTPSSSETLYAQWESAASCSANPSIGDASLNGSISLSSIPLSISSVGGGTDCTLAEYGFVWKAGSAPSASDNKTKIGESSSTTSFTGNITGSFSTGVTYYIKGYAINNGPNTTLSSTALPITPRSITFNSNGGSPVSTAYVNDGATVSKPSNPTMTGYTFGTWQLSGSDYNFSTSVTGNITLVATWNAKTTTISLNKNNSDASGSTAGSASYTYGESTKNSYTAATRTGYTLNGYYTATSAGTKILNADGTIAGNSIVVSTVTYTDGSGNWAYDGTSLTLYAQWTVNNYTVTWKVNNTNYTTGTPTDNVNHGSKVTKLPTAPDPGDYCGDKFMGWTDADGGVYTHGTSNLYTSASQFPDATGNQIFYAVFADYDE